MPDKLLRSSPRLARDPLRKTKRMQRKLPKSKPPRTRSSKHRTVLRRR